MFRLDSGKLNWERVKGGRLKAFVTLGVAEKPLEYYSLDTKGRIQKRVESITEKELRSDRSLNSATGGPMLLGHPKKNEGRFKGNAEGLMVGSLMQEVITEPDGSVVLAGTITDDRGDYLIKDTADRFNGLLPEISPAYELDRLLRADSIEWQEGRLYDHFALLYPLVGRGGQDIPLRLDSADRLQVGYDSEERVRNYWIVDSKGGLDANSPAPKTESKPGKTMKTIIVKKRAFNIDASGTDIEALAVAVDALDTELSEAKDKLQAATSGLAAKSEEATQAIARADAADTALATEKATAAALKAKVTELEGTAVDADQLRKDRADAIETAVLVADALNLDAADIDYSLSGDDWRKKFLGTKELDINLDEASPQTIQAMWTVLKPKLRQDSSAPLLDIVNRQTGELNSDAKGDKASAAAREEMIKRRQEASKRIVGAA